MQEEGAWVEVEDHVDEDFQILNQIDSEREGVSQYEILAFLENWVQKFNELREQTNQAQWGKINFLGDLCWILNGLFEGNLHN